MSENQHKRKLVTPDSDEEEHANKKLKNSPAEMSTPQQTATKADDDLRYDNEWSRLLHAIGKDALKKLQNAKVLISGLKGLGIEVAKNIVLMGARSVTVHDPGTVALSDLSSQFFLSEEHVGKNRADASLPKLRELNPRVDLSVHAGELTDDVLIKYTVVFLSNITSMTNLLRISSFCHSNNIGFMAGDMFGLFGYVFVDLGEKFVCTDKTGEPEKKGFVEVITQDEIGLVQLPEGKRHDLSDGEYVTFSGVKGMEEVNHKEFKITVKDPYSFTIGDLSKFSAHQGGGQFTEVKKPSIIGFSSLATMIKKQPQVFAADPDCSIADYSKYERPAQYFLLIQALYKILEKGGALPKPGNEADAEKVLQVVKEVNDTLEGENKVEKIDEKLLKQIIKQAAGDLSPMAAFLGGVIAQEIIKATSGKFNPLKQWFMFDSLECLPDAELSEEEVSPVGSRYDGQIAVFGKKIQDQVFNSRYFLIGAGAIGCEMLKNWAMMGLGSGPKGYIQVTDMDAIEISNLNRQFLYREWDVKHMKSEVASKAVKVMNPALNIKALTLKVGSETENVFNDAFWEDLTGICNALDNVHARLYTDSRAILYKKSLLESGTLGPKGNTQVIVPDMTESYGSTSDPPEAAAPMCLVHSFPNNIQHCLQWARELTFEGRLINDPDLVTKYLEKPEFLKDAAPTSRRGILEALRDSLVNRETTFDQCITWARLLFEKNFNHDLKQTLHNFPADFKDPKTNTPFWSGAKVPPTPTVYNPEDPLHLTFVVAATFLRAFTMGVIDNELKQADYKDKVEHIKKVSATIKVPEFQPKKVKIISDENDNSSSSGVIDEDDQVVESIKASLPPPAHFGAYRPRILDFEKDDDSNFHIDFIHAAANIRAGEFKIPIVDRLQSKLIAGRIVPAIVTTTASVTGLVCLEYFKLVQGKKLEQYRNTFINLAIPTFQQSEPVPPKKIKFGDEQISLWSRLEIRQGDLTLQQLLDYLKKNFEIEADIIGSGRAMIYSSFNMSKEKLASRLNKPISACVSEITKEPLKEGQKHISLDVTGTLKGEDVDEIPSILIWL